MIKVSLTTMHLSQLVSASVSLLFFQLASSYAIEVPEAVPRHEVSARIFGGYNADISDFPYQVQLKKLHKQDGVKQWKSICGGSIISKNFILTAAHCVVKVHATLDHVKAENLFVYANDSVQENLIGFPVKNIFKHPHLSIPPAWSNLSWKKDVAILELLNPLPLGPGIQVIPLAKADTTLPEGTKAVISGWGDTCPKVSPKRLQAAEVSIASKADCENCYGQKEDGICAGTFKDIPTKGGLPGDSGGPLVVNGVLEGVTIVIKPGCCPDLFVRIASSDIRAFIKNVTGI